MVVVSHDGEDALRAERVSGGVYWWFNDRRGGSKPGWASEPLLDGGSCGLGDGLRGAYGSGGVWCDRLFRGVSSTMVLRDC